MPWFPDFVAAVELARQQTRAAGKADPVGQYVAALNRGDTHDLETVWSGQVVVYDPRAGVVKSHRHLRQLVKHSQSLLAERQARSEAVASIVTANRAVVEVSVHLVHDGQAQVWPRWRSSPNPVTKTRSSSAPTSANGFLTGAAMYGPPFSNLDPGIRMMWSGGTSRRSRSVTPKRS